MAQTIWCSQWPLLHFSHFMWQSSACDRVQWGWLLMFPWGSPSIRWRPGPLHHVMDLSPLSSSDSLHSRHTQWRAGDCWRISIQLISQLHSPASGWGVGGDWLTLWRSEDVFCVQSLTRQDSDSRRLERVCSHWQHWAVYCCLILLYTSLAASSHLKKFYEIMHTCIIFYYKFLVRSRVEFRADSL